MCHKIWSPPPSPSPNWPNTYSLWKVDTKFGQGVPPLPQSFGQNPKEQLLFLGRSSLRRWSGKYQSHCHQQTMKNKCHDNSSEACLFVCSLNMTNSLRYTIPPLLQKWLSDKWSTNEKAFRADWGHFLFLASSANIMDALLVVGDLSNSCKEENPFTGQSPRGGRSKLDKYIHIWVICYCWENSSMVEGRFSKWF